MPHWLRHFGVVRSVDVAAPADRVEIASGDSHTLAQNETYSTRAYEHAGVGEGVAVEHDQIGRCAGRQATDIVASEGPRETHAPSRSPDARRFRARQILLAWLRTRAPSPTLQAFVDSAVRTCAAYHLTWTRDAERSEPGSE
jgi:hypothetical protein